MCDECDMDPKDKYWAQCLHGATCCFQSWASSVRVTVARGSPWTPCISMFKCKRLASGSANQTEFSPWPCLLQPVFRPRLDDPRSLAVLSRETAQYGGERGETRGGPKVSGHGRPRPGPRRGSLTGRFFNWKKNKTRKTRNDKPGGRCTNDHEHQCSLS